MSGDAKLKKTESEEINALLKKTDTSIDFYKRFDAVYKYDDNLSAGRARNILKLVGDALTSDNKFRNKFFALAFAGLLAGKYEQARTAVARGSLATVLIDQLVGEVSRMRESLGAKSVKSWKERYFSLAVETLAAVARADGQQSRRARSFFSVHNLDQGAAPFYLTLSYSRIREVQADIGTLSRKQAGQRERRLLALPHDLRRRARGGRAQHQQRLVQRLQKRYNDFKRVFAL